jgi:hypothetical protein
MLSKNKVELCPGNVCSFNPPLGAGGTWVQGAVLAVFLVAVFIVAGWVYGHPGSQQVISGAGASTAPQDPAEAERCKVPEFAKKIGHEQQWKLHNGCQ